MEISKTYNPAEIEQKWYKYWENNKYFTPEIDKDKRPYTVLIPPPNVTGILHIGHVLNNTLQDIAVRYKRMTGVPTLWIPGMDHAGIATQNVVEKELAKEGLDRHQIGREELVKRIWKWKEEKGGKIIQQLKLLGASCDWTRERFTLDDTLSKAVKEVFVSLYNKGLIYKGKYIINWCPRCVSALSNDEVDHYDVDGKLWYIKYPLKDKKTNQPMCNQYLTVATTRPETMLGDVAVAINPDDERYAHLAGEKLILPFVEREIPIILDEYVDKDFGTGVVKITPAHDPNDFEIGKRHQLEPVVVMDETGYMNQNAGKDFVGLERFACREKLIQLLQSHDLIDNIDDHSLSIGKCYRCDSVVEPYLSTQWFVKMKPLSEKAISAVEREEIKFQPSRWTKVFMHWMNNIRDWCISRQIWWGHRIPAYYCGSCNEVVVVTEKPEICPVCNCNSFIQDEDVLDTWFSSWLWPFSTMGWPNDTEDLRYYLPTDLLVTAPEIIYLWVARMIMSTYEFCGCKPFNTVLLHGTVRDEQGRKMSKSLGNSPDPINIIEEVGADALRFSMVFNTPKGADIHYSANVLENGRNFCNKIWNAYRYIMTNANKVFDVNQTSFTSVDSNITQIMDNYKPKEFTEIADEWIYSRLNEVIEEVTGYYERLRYNDAAQLLQDFIWKDYCSWYLELTKDRIYKNDNINEQRTVIYILLDVLQQSMRLLHPLMPFLSEEIWQNIKLLFPMSDDALVIAAFPAVDKQIINVAVKDQMEQIKGCITAIRNLRKQVNIPLGKEADVSINFSTKSVNNNKIVTLLERHYNYFQKLAKVGNLEICSNQERPKGCIGSVVGDLEVYLQLTGVIDIDKEKERLHKILDKTGTELEKSIKKLSNDNFLNKAKNDIIQNEHNKKEDLQLKFDKTKQLWEDISKL